jgi:mRNA interferase MazF
MYKQGKVLLAQVFSTGAGEFKKRPVVVVGNEHVIDIDVIISPVTSHDSRGEFDIVIEHWKEAGLMMPSVARTSKLSAIPRSSIIKELGCLHKDDLDRILDHCRRLF